MSPENPSSSISYSDLQGNSVGSGCTVCMWALCSLQEKERFCYEILSFIVAPHLFPTNEITMAIVFVTHLSF